MHSSKPQQVRRRNFDLEQYDGSCRQSFPFVKWIDSTIESMGALNILDKNAQPDHCISEAQIFAKAAHESRLLETSEAFKRAHARWTERLFQWNNDTIAFHAIGGFMSQDEILNEQDRIGIKPVEPTYVFHDPNTRNMVKETWTRLRNWSSSNKRWLDKSWSLSRIVANNKSWITPT